MVIIWFIYQVHFQNQHQVDFNKILKQNFLLHQRISQYYDIFRVVISMKFHINMSRIKMLKLLILLKSRQKILRTNSQWLISINPLSHMYIIIRNSFNLIKINTYFYLKILLCPTTPSLYPNLINLNQSERK